MVDLTLWIPRGRRLGAVPSVRADPNTYHEKPRNMREGKFALSCVCAGRQVDLAKAGNEPWTHKEQHRGEWSVVSKTAGGPRGPREPLHDWYRNPQFRVYVGEQTDMDQQYS